MFLAEEAQKDGATADVPVPSEKTSAELLYDLNKDRNVIKDEEKGGGDQVEAEGAAEEKEEDKPRGQSC